MSTSSRGSTNKAYVYDARTGEKLKEFRYPGEGWGLTTDGKKLYMSDGTANIYTLDPGHLQTRKAHHGDAAGARPLNFLNELEWIDGKIWANVYTTDQIVIIDPGDGRGGGNRRSRRGCCPKRMITPATDVLNGIAYDAAGGRIFVTGKNWNKLFEIEISREINGRRYTNNSNPASCCSTAASARWSSSTD